MSTISWFLYDLSGDPLAAYIGPTSIYRMRPAQIEAFREKLGLNKPWYIRYMKHLNRLIRGDWGYSPYHGYTPVLELLQERFPSTAELAIISIFIAIIIGIPLGIISAVKKDQKTDYFARPLLLSFYSIPIFVSALWLRLTIIKIAVHLGRYFDSREIHYLFPSRERYNPQLSTPPQSLLFGLLQPTDMYLIDGMFSLDPIFFLDAFFHIIYPAAILGASLMAIIARMTRMAMIEVLRADYILLARAKGLSERVIIYRHALRNAMLPVLTVGGIILANLLTGAVFVEIVFYRYGIGMMITGAVKVLDMPAIQGFCLLSALIYVITNLVVDLLYAWLDPRIRETN
ncbi:MAG: ABC transporter permease [Promethearchaeota archaeon]